LSTNVIFTERKIMSKNILFIYHNAQVFGGGDESLLALLSRLDRNRFNPYVLCTSSGLFTDKLKKLNIKFKIIYKDYLHNIGRIRLLFFLIRLCLFVKKNKIKLVHINSLGKLHYLTFLCKLMGICSIYHLRSLMVTRTLTKRTRFIINHSDKIIAHCKHMKKTAIEAGLYENKINVIYNGVNLNEFNPEISGGKFRRELGIANNTNLIGMIGRIVPWKGYDDFIKAAKEVLKSIPDTKFVIVGEAPERSYLDKLIRLSEELGVKDKIIFTGLYSDTPRVFASLDLFVLSSWEEPFARVVLEAQASGKPVIGTNTGGTPEQIIDKVTGLLVPPKNPAYLAEAIIKLLRDKEKAKQMGTAGRKRVEQLFSIEKHVKAVESIYRNLLGFSRILIYSHEFPPFGSGAGSYCYGIAKGLAKLNQKVTILTTRYFDKNIRYHESYPFKVIQVPRIEGTKERFLSLLYFLCLLFRDKPHHILIVEKWAQEVASLVHLIVPFSYYLTVHGSEVLTNIERKKGRYKSRLLAWILKRFYDKAKKIITVSNYTKELLLQAGISDNKIAVIPNGIDIERFSKPSNSNRLRHKLRLNEEDKIILTLTVLKPRKGQDMVIKALPYVVKKLSNVKYLIAGFGEDKKRLQNLVTKNGLERHVIFTGFIPDEEILDYYDLCNVFVMLSRQEGPRVEGFGIPFIEANARGKPVIGGRHGGVTEVVIDGVTGLIVDPYNPEEIANAIIKILTDHELAQKIGQYGRDRCLSFYNCEDIAQRTLNVML
jgi:phosphatidylinositol alpha-1,6-mannosyltransferase